jgi:hypothetical protein
MCVEINHASDQWQEIRDSDYHIVDHVFSPHSGQMPEMLPVRL